MNEPHIPDNPIDPPEPGCYIEGHWGQYGPARSVEIAIDYGFTHPDLGLASRKMALMHPHSHLPDLTADEEERLVELADAAEAWLNENVSSKCHTWWWEDGEFFYGWAGSDDD